MKNNIIKIDDKEIGVDRSTYIIAEAGSNHNNNLGTAKKLIDAAANAGADAVKFQVFKAKYHYSKFTPSFSYLESQYSTKSTYDLISSVELERSWLSELINYAKEKKITFLASPCDVFAIDQLNELGMPAFKVASFDLPDLSLIRYIASLQKPLILSVGMANYKDIQEALNVCMQMNNEQIIILQCTSLYPAPVNLTNLAAMDSIKNAFNVIVGYSDHTLEDHIVLAAVARGALVIEKHFTLDCNQPGPDHKFALEPDALARMIKKIRDIEKAVGDGVKNGPSQEEFEMFMKGRRSIHVKCALKAGEVLTKDALCIKRPGLGISPFFLDVVAGMILQKDIQQDYWLTWDDLKKSYEK